MNLPNGWKNTNLSEILSSEPQNGYSPNCVDYNTGKWVLGLGNLTESGLSLKTLKNVLPDDNRINTFNLQKGDFLISRSNTPEKVGRVGVFHGEIENCHYPDLMMRFRVNEKIANISFVEKILTSFQTQRYFQSCAAGSSSTMVKINKETVKNAPLLLPPLPEQKAIAALLSTWDSAIEKMERLISAKEKKQKLVSNWLLFGHKRINRKTESLAEYNYYKLPIDWKLVKIESVGNEVSVRNNDVDATVLSCSKYAGFVDSLDYFGKKVYSDDISNYKVIAKWQFGYPANHIEEGSIGFLEHRELGIVSPIYVVFSVTCQGVYPPYLYKILKSDVYRHIFQTSTSASVDRRGSLRWDEFSKIRIPIPPIEEQRNIADTINAMNAEVKMLKALLEKYKLQKRGLMQNLLTGEWRVKTEINQPEGDRLC